MKATIVLDTKAKGELEELSRLAKTSMSEIIRTAVDDLYLKEKRAREGFSFYVGQYVRGMITQEMLFMLLPRKDAEAIIIGSATGKEAAEFAKQLGY